MPVYRLETDLVFPDPSLADESGLLAIGGDLSVARLILAYSKGIFPWYSEGEPIMWWSPDPRMILFPEELNVSKSLQQTMKNKRFEIRFDTVFEKVIDKCSKVPRPGQHGTWITNELKEAFLELHRLGLAHSVETFTENKLVGGLYGLSLGKAFFGESMFHEERDASKFALYHLVEKVKNWKFLFIDAQVETNHMIRMGAKNMDRSNFINLLEKAIKLPTEKGKW